MHLSALKQLSALPLPFWQILEEVQPLEAVSFCGSSSSPLHCLYTSRFHVTDTHPSWDFLLLGTCWVLEQVPVTVDFYAAEVGFSSLTHSWDRPRHLDFISFGALLWICKANSSLRRTFCFSHLCFEETTV